MLLLRVAERFLDVPARHLAGRFERGGRARPLMGSIFNTYSACSEMSTVYRHIVMAGQLQISQTTTGNH